MEGFESRFEKSLAALIGKRAAYSSFSEEKLSFTYVDPSRSEISELSSLLDTFMGIAGSPHRKSEPHEIVERSELASSLTPDEFRKTYLDSSFWRQKKDGSFYPEYVYGSEYDDNLLTYENKAVYFIFRLIKARLEELSTSVKEEGNSLEKLYQSPLAIFPEEGPLYTAEKRGKSVAAYLLKKKEDSSGELLLKALSKAKRLLSSQFVRTLMKANHEVILPLQPTNILIHDPRYNRLYRYYLSYLSKEGKGRRDSPYVYLAYRLLQEMTKAGYRLAQEPNFKYKDGTFTITAFAFSLDGFLYHCKIDEDVLRIEILYRGAVYRREVYLYDTFLPTADNREVLAHHYVVCLKNLSSSYDGILEVDPLNKEAVFPRLFAALSLVLSLDGKELDHCPVCGSSALVSSAKKELLCPKCESLTALLGGRVDPAIWIASIRGR